MKWRSNLLPVFFIFLILALLLFAFPHKGITGLIEQAVMPIKKLVFTTFHKKEVVKSDEGKLREENEALLMQLAKQKNLEKENKALRDQFDTTNPSPRTLLPAQVVGMSLDQIIIDKGEGEGIKVGYTVIVKDNLIGTIIKTSPHLSVVNLVSNEKVSLTVATAKTSALGVVTGKGEDILILNNVVLSDKLEKADLVVTKGDMNEKGRGFPPGLVVGKIMSVNKKSSDVFQRAEVKSLIDFEKLQMVFVMKD